MSTTRSKRSAPLVGSSIPTIERHTHEMTMQASCIMLLCLLCLSAADTEFTTQNFIFDLQVASDPCSGRASAVWWDRGGLGFGADPVGSLAWFDPDGATEPEITTFQAACAPAIATDTIARRHITVYCSERALVVELRQISGTFLGAPRRFDMQIPFDALRVTATTNNAGSFFFCSSGLSEVQCWLVEDVPVERGAPSAGTDISGISAAYDEVGDWLLFVLGTQPGINGAGVSLGRFSPGDDEGAFSVIGSADRCSDFSATVETSSRFFFVLQCGLYDYLREGVLAKETPPTPTTPRAYAQIGGTWAVVSGWPSDPVVNMLDVTTQQKLAISGREVIQDARDLRGAKLAPFGESLLFVGWDLGGKEIVVRTAEAPGAPPAARVCRVLGDRPSSVPPLGMSCYTGSCSAKDVEVRYPVSLDLDGSLDGITVLNRSLEFRSADVSGTVVFAGGSLSAVNLLAADIEVHLESNQTVLMQSGILETAFSNASCACSECPGISANSTMLFVSGTPCAGLSPAATPSVSPSAGHRIRGGLLVWAAAALFQHFA